MELYGLFMEILWKNLAQSQVVMRHHGRTYGKFMDFHGYFHGKLMDPPFHKIRLLGPEYIRGGPVKQLQFLELDRILWERENCGALYRSSIKGGGALNYVIKLRIINRMSVAVKKTGQEL
jgi:hypothetical protein